jgi:acetyl-CoA synthetase
LGGKLNVTDSCLKRHALSERAKKTAIVWEGERGEIRKVSYGELYQQVKSLAGVLSEQGICPGDRVAIYMPLVPEIAVAMLACAYLGATHSVIFGGFSAESVRHRVNDASCKAVICADGGHRKGAVIGLKSIVDEALENDAAPSVKTVVVLKHSGSEVSMTPGRDLWWHEAVTDRMARAADAPLPPACVVDAEHPLFILYTSGTTGKPKGLIHSTGGYLTQVLYTAKAVLDLKDDDIYWCTADAGWITGHSYVVYGPLAAGATVFMYEGAPTYPSPDRFWAMIARHKISILYTAPTAIRTFMRMGDEHIKRHDLASLRLLGSVGEPINPEAWMWYRDVVGGNRCPIVDTWWQTETGAMMIAPLPGVTVTAPGSATKALPGIEMDIAEGGFLVAKKPWPAMARGIWGDNERYRETYWSQIQGTYFTGDGAKRDSDDYFWIMGRIDDVVNVSGHRIGTMEVESALVAHAGVAEAAVVAVPDDITGQALVAFVTLKQTAAAGNAAISFEALKNELKGCVAKDIGSFARPRDIRFANALPKTRSGKIMRRLLKELACTGKVTGDVTTLEDMSAVTSLGSEQP